MKLEDLKVIDIIQMPQFEKHIEALYKRVIFNLHKNNG